MKFPFLFSFQVTMSSTFGVAFFLWMVPMKRPTKSTSQLLKGLKKQGFHIFFQRPSFQTAKCHIHLLKRALLRVDNRMPSSVLHDQIPHSILLPTQPLFYLPPRVFGCVCFVHILTPGQDKLSTKATKCVFLGYSRLQRGYRCYSPDTNHYFISANVTFFEDSPFFSSAMHPSVLNVLFIPLVLPSPDFPSPPTDVVTRPLQVYTRRPCPPIGPRVNSSLMPQSSPAPIPQLSDDLPIAIRKVPALLLTHILFIIFLAFIVYLYLTLSLFPPCLMSLPLKALVRLSLIRAGNRQWLRKWMLFTPMTHGNLSLFLLASLLLVVVGFIQ